MTDVYRTVAETMNVKMKPSVVLMDVAMYVQHRSGDPVKKTARNITRGKRKKMLTIATHVPASMAQ